MLTGAKQCGKRTAKCCLDSLAAGLVELREVRDRRRKRLQLVAAGEVERVQRAEVVDRLGQGRELGAVGEVQRLQRIEVADRLG